jgi:uncharacterized protein
MFKRKRQAKAKSVNIEHIRAVVKKIAFEHGVQDVFLFGSFARKTQTTKSDVDVIVHMPEGSSLFDLMSLKEDLQSALHRKVDVLTENGIHPRLRNRILQEVQIL